MDFKEQIKQKALDCIKIEVESRVGKGKSFTVKEITEKVFELMAQEAREDIKNQNK